MMHGIIKKQDRFSAKFMKSQLRKRYLHLGKKFKLLGNLALAVVLK